MESLQALIDQLKREIEGGKSDEEIFSILQQGLGKDLQKEERIAEWLGTLSHRTAAKLLLMMSDVASSKHNEKAIRRSLYRLRGKGIAYEEEGAPKGEPILRPPKAEPATAFGSGLDALGERLLLLVLPHPGRGMTVIQTGVSDTEGLVNFVADEMSRKGWKAFLQGLREEVPFPLVEMEPSYVAFLISRAYQLVLQKQSTPPQEYLHVKTEIDGVKKDYKEPPVYALLRADEILNDGRWLTRSGDLLKSDSFATWEIGKALVQPYIDLIQQAEESKLVLNPAQKEARFQEIYLKALSDLFGEERRELYRRRLEDMAEFLFRLGRQEEAQMSLAAAVDLKAPFNPFQPNPFLFRLVIKSILLPIKEDYEKKTNEPSLIVKP